MTKGPQGHQWNFGRNSDLPDSRGLTWRSSPATLCTEVRQESRNGNQGCQDCGRKDHLNNPCPTAVTSNKTLSFQIPSSDPCCSGPERGKGTRLEAGPLASRQEKAKDLAAWASFSPELPFAYVLFLDPKPTPAPTSASSKEHKDQPAGWGEAYLLSRGTSLRLHPPVERMTAQRKPPLLPQSPAPGVPGPLGKAEPLCHSKDHASGHSQRREHCGLPPKELSPTWREAASGSEG